MQADDLSELFNLPLSEQAVDELLSMQIDIQRVLYDVNDTDIWSFLWGDSKYTSRRFYKLAFKHLAVPPIFSWVLEVKKCIPRLKFFAWLILMDRFNTRDMLQRRNFNVQPNIHCVMCNDQAGEDLAHLFFDCPFAFVSK